MFKDSSVKYYQKSKEKVPKKCLKGNQMFPKE